MSQEKEECAMPPKRDESPKECTTKGKKEEKLKTRNFFLMKKFIDDPDVKGSLLLAGTFIQIVLGLDKKEAESDEGFYFKYRFNEKSATDDTVQKRRTQFIETVDENDKPVYGSRTTFQTIIPLEMDVPFTAFPFQICTGTAAVELSSTFKDKFTVRPDLLLHKKDPRKNFVIQELKPIKKNLFFGKENVGESDPLEERIMHKVDVSKKFDFISPYPSLHYEYDKNKKYCTRFEMTFYCFTADFLKILAIILPMFLITIITTINLINEWTSYIKENNDNKDDNNDDKDDNNDDSHGDVLAHLQVTSALTLAAVLILPQIVDSSSNQHVCFKNFDSVYVTLIFVSLVFSSFPSKLVRGFVYLETIGVAGLWLSFCIPIVGYYRFSRIKNKIKEEMAIWTKKERFYEESKKKKKKGNEQTSKEKKKKKVEEPILKEYQIVKQFFEQEQSNDEWYELTENDDNAKFDYLCYKKE